MTNKVNIQGESNIEIIKNRIYEVRGQRVMLDRNLAELYGVETKVLNQAVKRNIERFPEDFMFRMDNSEWEFLRSQIVTSKIVPLNTDIEEDKELYDILRSQIVTSKDGRGGVRYTPYAFTELGIAMLSSVLRSETAIQVNINIMRAFVMIRQAVAAWQDTNLKVEQLSHKVDQLNNYVEEILHDQNQKEEKDKMTVLEDVKNVQWTSRPNGSNVEKTFDSAAENNTK